MKILTKDEVVLSVMLTEQFLKSEILDDPHFIEKYKETFNLREEMEKALFLLKNLRAALETNQCSK